MCGCRQDREASMNAIITTPRQFFEAVSEFRLSQRADARLQHLMDLNNDGQLNASEREELATLAEMSEELSLLRAQARQLLLEGK
jgi:hypothetical protein